jgi:hypothetical protein
LVKFGFRASFVAVLLAGVVLGGVGSSAEVEAHRVLVKVGGVCVREGARNKVAGKRVVCVSNAKKQLRWRFVKAKTVRVVTATTTSTSVAPKTTVAPTTTSSTSTSTSTSSTSSTSTTSSSSTTSTSTSTSVVGGDRMAPVVTLGRSAGSSGVATLTFTVTGNEPIVCSTLSIVEGVDFRFTRISRINSIVQTTEDVCTISVQSTAEPGDTNPRASVLTAADTFSITDRAGNVQTVLSGSPQTIWVQRIARPVISLSATTETANLNAAMNGYTITSTGGTVASYSLTGTLPAGVSFSTTTGRITGTPTATQTATTYTITATNTSGSTTATFTLTVVRTCASGGECIVGNTGPGGGIVFYVAPTTFACGATLASACKYLEAAPTSGAAAWTDATYAWSGNTTTAIGVDARGTVIGTGLKNTLAMETDATRGANRAGTKTRDYRGPNSLTDWYLPSKDELNELCKYARNQTTGDTAVGCAATGTLRAGFNNTAGVGLYWSSTESGGGFPQIDAWGQQFGVPLEGDIAIGAQGEKTKSQATTINVRPVRAFG